ncbi:hypothetical protein ATANTOWER_008252, partial [Ataeniobius toweri]|nr:hypothetical protein [Ataeniobius toweri]
VQNWCPRLDQEDLKPPHIKEEQDDGEIVEFIFSPVPVKNEDGEEKPQLSEIHQSQAEESRDSVGPESYDENKTSDSVETDISDGNWGRLSI